MIQMRAFFQHLILIAKHRTVDEVDIHRLYEHMYPAPIATAIQPVEKSAYAGSEADLIAQLLSQYDGNRSRVASAPGHQHYHSVAENKKIWAQR